MVSSEEKLVSTHCKAPLKFFQDFKYVFSLFICQGQDYMRTFACEFVYTLETY